jgi:hypothetical protein
MWLVAAQTVLIGHFLRMALVTFHTFLKLFMLQVALITIKVSVHARVIHHLLAFIRMTAGACRLDIIDLCEIHHQGVVGVVAHLAIRSGIMGLISGIVAHGTLWNDFFPKFRVFQVAIEATYISLMLRPQRVYVFHLVQMAL